MTQNMEPRTKLHFDLDGRHGNIYYSYEHRENFDIDSNYYFYDPRDEDGVIIHYPPPTPELVEEEEQDEEEDE